MKAALLLWVHLLNLQALTGQTVQTQTRTSTDVRVLFPENWVNTDWQSVSADDNVYIKSKSKLGILGSINFLGFGFSIPSGAKIQKIDATVIRLKNGRNKVSDHFVSLQTSINNTDDYGGAYPNVAKTGYWDTKETTVTYTNPASGTGATGQPYLWTPELINHKLFGLFFHAGIGTGGSGAAVYIEKVSIAVYYTTTATTSSIQAGREKDADALSVKQMGSNLFINTKQGGTYRLAIFDPMGRLLHRESIKGPINRLVPLHMRLKGLYIILLEGNGQRKTQHVLLQ